MLILDYMAKVTGKKNYNNTCKAKCDAGNYECFSKDAAELGWPVGMSQPPFYFTEISLFGSGKESGIGLQVISFHHS